MVHFVELWQRDTGENRGRLGYVSVTHVLEEKGNYKCLCLTAPMLMLLIAFLGENLFVSHGHDTVSVGRSVVGFAS